MTTAVSRQNRTLSDALIPYSGLWVDIATIIVGSLVIAAFAQFKYTLPTTVVPITGQTFAVLLVAATVGSKRGGLAAVLYLIEGCIWNNNIFNIILKPFSKQQQRSNQPVLIYLHKVQALLPIELVKTFANKY